VECRLGDLHVISRGIKKQWQVACYFVQQDNRSICVSVIWNVVWVLGFEFYFSFPSICSSIVKLLHLQLSLVFIRILSDFKSEWQILDDLLSGFVF
jgi:hypothetical protein